MLVNRRNTSLKVFNLDTFSYNHIITVQYSKRETLEFFNFLGEILYP